MKKFNEQRNVIGNLIKEYREKKNYTKTRFVSKIIYKIENGKMIVKDFELIALSIVLDIPFDEIKKLVDFD